MTIVVMTKRAEGKFEARGKKIQEICARFNLNHFIKRDFRLEVGENSVYFVLKNRMVAKRGGLGVSKASWGERLMTVGEEEENYVSGESAESLSVNLQERDLEGSQMRQLGADGDGSNGIEQKML